jgi:hypothetical protein
MNKIQKISKVVSQKGGRRKLIRNIFRKNRSLIGKGYKKVKGSRRIVRMTSQEKRKYNPMLNRNIRKALRMRKIKQRLTNLKRKRTLRTGVYKSLHRKKK